MKCSSAQNIVSRETTQLYENEDIPDALAMILSGLVEVEDKLIAEHIPNADTDVMAAINHISQCGACAEWSTSLSPKRKENIAKANDYCCTEMFKSVSGQIAEIGFTREYGRSETPYWYLNQINVKFCPWCGRSLAQMNHTPILINDVDDFFSLARSGVLEASLGDVQFIGFSTSRIDIAEIYADKIFPFMWVEQPKHIDYYCVDLSTGGSDTLGTIVLIAQNTIVHRWKNFREFIDWTLKS